MEENEHRAKKRMCEVSCKTPTSPMWPPAPHWLSACQTNCFGWQRAVKTAWSRTCEWRNSYSFLPFGPGAACMCLHVAWEWQDGVSPWNLWSYSSPPCAHIPLGIILQLHTSSLTVMELHFWDPSVTLLPEPKIASSSSSFVHPPLKPQALPLEVEWK